MKILLEVEFPDNFEFPDRFDPYTLEGLTACQECPFYAIDMEEDEICFLKASPICGWYEGQSDECPLKDGAKKVCITDTRKKLSE